VAVYRVTSYLQGTQFNRNGSLLIKNNRIAAYYEEVFLHDWERLAKLTIREEATPIRPTRCGCRGLSIRTSETC
jgi:hypothetical protein